MPGIRLSALLHLHIRPGITAVCPVIDSRLPVTHSTGDSAREETSRRVYSYFYNTIYLGSGLLQNFYIFLKLKAVIKAFNR